MSALDELYPADCPFCNIAKAYPAGTNPVPQEPDPERVSPQCHLILSSPHVLAFLDILPMAPGHILLTTRDHHRKLSDLYDPSRSSDWLSQRSAYRARETTRALGEYLPLLSRALCKVTGIEDWNVVQNNGERAAQVVPHVHFHLIPRYQEGRRDAGGKGKINEQMLKNWRMFGRGTREELDDDEGKQLAAHLRNALQVELERNLDLDVEADTKATNKAKL